MNYRDAQLLNDSIRGLGDTLLHERMIDQREKERADALRFRTEQFGEQKRHNAALESRADKAEERANEGKVNAWLEGPEGGTMNFSGPKSQLDQMLQASTAAGKPLKQVDQPKNEPAFGTIEMDTTLGLFKLRINRPQDLAHAQEGMKQLLPFLKQKPGFETAPGHNKNRWDADNAKADELERDAASESDATSTQRQVMLDQAKKIRADADLFFRPGDKEPARPFSLTTTDPQDPEAKITQRMTSEEYDAHKKNSTASAPADVKKREAGKRYKLPDGRIGIWQGSGWQIDK